MNDFQGLLSSDYGFKPQGKAAPMAPSRSNPSTGTANSSAFDFDIGGGKTSSYPKSSSTSSAPIFDDHDTLFRSSSTSRSDRKPNDFSNLGGLENVFSGSSKPTANSSVNLDSIFSRSGESEPKFSSLPVFDKPVYDEDVFDGVSGLKSTSSAKYEDIFSSTSLHPPAERHDAFDELLGGLGRKDPEPKGAGGSSSRKGEKGIPGFDDLLPGFGSSGDRASSDRSWVPKSPASETTKVSTSPDDPFVVLNSSSPPAPSSPDVYSDPMEQISKLSSSAGKKAESFSSTGGVFDDLDPLGGFGKSVPMNNREKSGSPVRTGSGAAGRQNSSSTEDSDRFSYVRSPERVSEKKMPPEDYHESPRNIFDIPSATIDSDGPISSSSPSNTNPTSQRTSHKHTTGNEENLDSLDDVWLTVFEIPLYTQPTVAPPPSRPPPPRPPRSKAKPGSFVPPYNKKRVDEYTSFSSSAQVPQASSVGGQSSFASPIDELEDFAKVRSWGSHDGNGDGEATDTNSVAAASAAAMKEAMDKAEARFRHAKGMRERENAKSARVQHEKEDTASDDSLEREYRERQERMEHERQERLERDRIEREEEERRQREEEECKRRTEREREKEERERERRKIERDLARQAMERATREARERAAVEARTRAEKAAVEKAHAEARGRAERAAVLRAQAEARERAARAAAEAKQKADREKAEREARERAEREAKEKEARDKAARSSQQRNEDDLESFFGGGSRASSAPRPRASSSFQSQPSKPPEPVRSSVGSTASMRKASSSTNIVDDLSSIFGAAPSAGEFNDIEGETEERRRARLERHHRTQERAAKALAEKNQRDLDVQQEQAERHRIAETLDVEIKRWAAGKEGNLRALLSTLQYVLWPGCGWQPVSLTDLINAASVKKAYRKATLCIHPDKVQQKGATLQQKYIAEKVFDLLKEAWNKFNSEELF